MRAEHVDYPHEAGRLYDCTACESECFCGLGVAAGYETECVYCAILAESCNVQDATEAGK